MYLNLKHKEEPKKHFSEETKKCITPFRDISQLTAREREVLVNILEGYTSKEIADRLFVCPETIDTHRKNIIRKFKVKNIAHAIAHAFRNNLIQ